MAISTSECSEMPLTVSAKFDNSFCTVIGCFCNVSVATQFNCAILFDTTNQLTSLRQPLFLLVKYDTARFHSKVILKFRF